MLRIRLATTADVPTIAHHRVQMFADMKVLPRHLRERLVRQTSEYLERAIPSGEYVGWLASVRGRPYEIVAGAGVQLRPVLPHPVNRCGRVALTGGVQALVLNVFTAPAWRRRRVARLLMDEVLAWTRSNDIETLVLHASEDGRQLYEGLAFQLTNEMRLVNTTRSGEVGTRA
ncbi:MAG TPA: GNAT family N-acetyltransferase [Candidatus Udaeobacter sp.]|nr:GNAT family N-acetyltransferase [Candidatus Udaeobacter sp.]